MNVKETVEKYSLLDEPVPFRGLNIYPVLVKDYVEFVDSYEVCQIDKNKIPDIEIISMSYLKFLLTVLFQDITPVDEKTVAQIYSDKLITLLCGCCRVTSEEIEVLCENGQYYLVIKGNKLNGSDFDELVKIISYQNIPDYSDEYVNPDIKAAVNEYYRIKSKGIKMPDLEDKISYITASTGILKKDLLYITYREFEHLFNSCIERLDYQIQKQAEMNGFVKFKKPVEHWVYKKQKDKYEEAFTSYEGFKNKIEQTTN